MPENLTSLELASPELSDTDSNEKPNAERAQNKEEQADHAVNCQNGVCLVSWKPQKTVAA